MIVYYVVVEFQKDEEKGFSMKDVLYKYPDRDAALYIRSMCQAEEPEKRFKVFCVSEVADDAGRV